MAFTNYDKKKSAQEPAFDPQEKIKGTLMAVKAAKKLSEKKEPASGEAFEGEAFEETESKEQEKAYMKKLMKKLGVRA
jgi:hypothetical protein